MPLKNCNPRRYLLSVVLASLLVGGVRAELPGGDQLWFSPEAEGSPSITLYFFWSVRCPHCREALPYVRDLDARYDWLRVEEYELIEEPGNRIRFLEMSALLGGDAQSVPTFMWCAEQYSGYHSALTTGRYLERQLWACYERVYGDPAPAGPPMQQAGEGSPISLPGGLEPEKLSLPLLTVVMGGLDAFNPCAFFILLFLLSLLVHAHSRRLMLLVGGVFIFFSGFIYFLFMAAWLSAFRWMGEIQVVTVLAGAVAVAMAVINIKDYYIVIVVIMI